ncbi:hypothetical protein GOV13_00090 [Candidatus Pacearchaeota archaeon]|nr:hypothetical protein [Candidatus Pacearchaeota archaeon]
MSKENLTKLIPSAIALAMGVASFVLLILNESQDTIITLLAIAVLCLGFVGIINQ